MKEYKKEKALVETSEYALPLRKQLTCPYWEDVTKVYVLVMFGLSQLLMGFRAYEDITESKYVLFKIGVFAYLICVFLVYVGYHLEKRLWVARKSCGFQKMTLAQILISAYTVWGTICAIVSPYENLWEGQSRFEGVLSMILYAAVFVLLAFWGEYHDYYIPVLAAATLLQGVFCVLQIFGADLFYPDGYGFYNIRFLGVIGNVDCVGGIIAIVVPALACGYILLRGKSRYLMLAATALMLWVQFQIDVDSSKMGLLVAIAITVPFLVTERIRIVRLLRVFATAGISYFAYQVVKLEQGDVVGISFAFGKRAAVALAASVVFGVLSWLLERSDKPFTMKPIAIRLIVVGAEVVAVVAAMIAIYRYEGDNVLLYQISQVLHGNLLDEAGSGRGVVWKYTWKMMKDNPIFGVGPGGYFEAFSPYNQPEWGVVFDFAHNDFLQVGSCTGFVGLALYVAFILVLAVRAVRYADRCPLVIIFASSMVGYLVHSFFAFSIAIVTPMFWVMIGLMEKCMRQVPPVASEGKSAVEEQAEPVQSAKAASVQQKPVEKKKK